MRAHEVDVLSLMAGVGFAGFGLITLVSQDAGLGARWKWPVLLILMGVVGLVASRRGGDRDRH